VRAATAATLARTAAGQRAASREERPGARVALLEVDIERPEEHLDAQAVDTLEFARAQCDRGVDPAVRQVACAITYGWW
jgi:hypothetical protein